MVGAILPEADGGLSQCHRADQGADTQPAKPLNEISMKKIILFSITVLTTTVASAETGTTGISDAADGVVTYMPYVRALCYVIAAIVAVVGAVAVYYTMQTSPQNTSKRIFMTAGSAFTFVCLSLALPQFFGIDGNMSGGGSGSAGSGTNGTSGTGTGFLASDQGGISRSGIITEIPSYADERWVHFPSGTRMETANFLLDIYDKNGAGAPGSYGNTLNYIHQLYHNREIDYGTFNVLMSLSGNLPHN